MQWWCNGDIVDPIYFGAFEGGVFESFRTFNGTDFWRLKEHWERWQHSGELLDIKISLDFETLERALSELVKVNRSENLDLRFKLWTDRADTWIKVEPLILTNVNSGVVIGDDVFARSTPQAKYGASFYTEFRQQCIDQNVDEIICFDEGGTLLEGSISNVFAVIDGELMTPKSDKILPGLMRKYVGAQERDISRSNLENASEIFLTNMVRGIVPVKQWGSWESDNFNVARSLQEKLAKSEGVFRMDGYNF